MSRTYAQPTTRKATAARRPASHLAPPEAAPAPAPEYRAAGPVTAERFDFSRIPVQPKRFVNAPGDAYEQEADRVADALSQAPRGPAQGEGRPLPQAGAPLVQRKCAECEAEEDDEGPLLSVQMKAAGLVAGAVPDGFEERLRALGDGGSPLPEALRREFEARFGYDFGRVRLHTDAGAAAAAESVGARAFTHGRHIAFAPGQYVPETADGRRLLAHEMTHVVQQATGGMVGGTGTLTPGLSGRVAIDRADSPGEREASAVAERVATGGPAGAVTQASDGALVQRSPADWFVALRDEARAADAKLIGAVEGAKESVSKAWSSGKVKVYQALLSTLRAGKDKAFSEIRAHLRQGPGLARSVLETLVNVCDTVIDILIALLVFLAGVIAGLAEGIVDLVIGLVRLVLGILKFFALFLLGFIDLDRRREFDEFAGQIIEGVKNIPEGLKTLVGNWIKEFADAPEAKQYGMIGELTGQIIAFIAGFEVAAAKAGNLPKLTAVIPRLPALEPALAVAGGGARAAAGATVVTIDTGAVVLAGGTVGTGATILASKAAGSGGGGGGQANQPKAPKQTQARRAKPESSELVETAPTARGFAIEDAQIAKKGYKGLPNWFKTIDAVTGGTAETIEEGGKAITVYRNARGISIKSTEIVSPSGLRDKITKELEELASFPGRTREGIRVERLASRRYELLFEQGQVINLTKEARAVLEEMRAYARSKNIQFQWYVFSHGSSFEGPQFFLDMAKELDKL